MRVRSAVHRAQVTRIVEQRGFGIAVSGAGLRLESRALGVGGIDVVAGVDARIAHLRAEVADLLQTLLDLLGRLGVQFISLVVSLDGLGWERLSAPICVWLHVTTLPSLSKP